MKTLRPLLIAFLHGTLLRSVPAADKIDWQPWTDETFAAAKAQNKFVILDLGAGWCHWCHVMDEITYADPAVIKEINAHYLAVRVDQDARPDLANRYEDYGWPATVIFKSNASELAKRRGYLPPKTMLGLLEAIVADPTPGPSVQPDTAFVASDDSALTEIQRSEARQLLRFAYDAKHGGWGEVHHYFDWHAIDYYLTEGAAGDVALLTESKQTLDSAQALLDPIWGGVYQYSTDGDWEHPHFEKIMPFQVETMRVLVMASTILQEPKYLAAAKRIHEYLTHFLLAPNGAFYVSQDADIIAGEHSGEYFALADAARRKQGIPRVDQHFYARENGLAIMGLCTLYAATLDADILAQARRAATWTIENRSLANDGFRHDGKDSGGPYLADTLCMARAFLSLYSVTAEPAWLNQAEASLQFCNSQFHAADGFLSTKSLPPFVPKPQVDENIELCRLAIALHHHTGNDIYLNMAQHAMKYLASPTVVKSQGFGTSGILLADRDLRVEPLHLTIVGSKTRDAAKTLFQSALQAAPTAWIEWSDPATAPLRKDASFPTASTPVAFVCTNGSCSAPVHSSADLRKIIAKHFR